METQLVVRMPRDFRETLERAARDEERPVGNLVRVLIGEALAARGKRRRK